MSGMLIHTTIKITDFSCNFKLWNFFTKKKKAGRVVTHEPTFRRPLRPSRVVTITTLFWLTNLSRGQTWRLCFEGRKWGGVRWEVLEFLQTNMKFSDFLQTWGVFLKMRRRHKQGIFWWFCTFYACPGTVRRFTALSRDCAWLWLIVGCHRVNSNFNLSHAVDFNSSAFCGRFRLKTEISDCIFVLLIF